MLKTDLSIDQLIFEFLLGYFEELFLLLNLGSRKKNQFFALWNIRGIQFSRKLSVIYFLCAYFSGFGYKESKRSRNISITGSESG